MRRSLPILLGAVVLAGLGVGVLLLASSAEDPQEIDRVVRAHYVALFTKGGHQEGTDWHLGAVRPLTRTDTTVILRADIERPGGMEAHYLRLARQGREWVVQKDLRDDFKSWIDELERQRALHVRLGKVIADRYRKVVEFPEGLDYRFLLHDEGGALLATVELEFDAGVVAGRYQEIFRYADGWSADGPGRVFEKPRP